ncbi:MAG: hypothetical protein AAF962_19950 [Actinomycetota bacterium]
MNDLNQISSPVDGGRDSVRIGRRLLDGDERIRVVRTHPDRLDRVVAQRR